MKVIEQKLYTKATLGKLTLEETMKFMNLKTIDIESNYDHCYLDYCLCNETKEEHKKLSGNPYFFNSDRKEIIKSFCRIIDNIQIPSN